MEIIDVSSVSEVEIDRYGGPCKKYAPMLFSLLEKIGNAEVVNLSDSILHLLAYFSMKGQAFPRNRWKHLILKSWIEEISLLAICGLVRNSASLEELTIYGGTSFRCFVKYITISAQNLLKELSSCVMPQLKTVPCMALGDLIELNVSFNW